MCTYETSKKKKKKQSRLHGYGRIFEWISLAEPARESEMNEQYRPNHSKLFTVEIMVPIKFQWYGYSPHISMGKATVNNVEW